MATVGAIRPHVVCHGAFLLVVSLLLPDGASAQARHPGSERLVRPDEFVHAWWTMEDGLPISHLTGVLQSRDGYLWLSSFDGLIRFDGVRFKVFNTTSNPELPTNRFREVLESPAGELWAVAEYDHVVRWAGDHFEVLGLGEDLQGTVLHELTFDDQGVPWLRTNRGMFILRDGSPVPFGGPNLRGPLTGMFRESGGAVWLGTDGNGAFRVDGEDVLQVSVRDQTGYDWASSFIESKDGTIYIGGFGAVTAYRDGETRAIRAPGVDTLLVRALVPLGGDSVLVVGDRALFTLVGGQLHERSLPIAASGYGAVSFLTTPLGERWLGTAGGQVYRNEQLVYQGDFPIMGMTLDREGNVWLASDGLHRLKRAVFQIFGEAEGSVSNVYPIMEDSQGRIWLGSLGGAALYEAGRFRTLQSEGMTNSIQALFQDREGRVWVGLAGYGACVLEAFHCGERVPYLGRHTVKAIYQDHAGRMWLGTDRGLFRETDEGVDHFTTADGLPHDFVRAIHEDRDGSLWLATNGGGLARMAGGGIESLGTADGLSSDLIRALYEDEAGVLWVGSEDRGLNRVELPAGASGEIRPLSEASISVIRQRDGLFDDGINAIIADGLGRLWMSTNRGIFWVLRTELEDFAAGRTNRVHSISYTERDGLRNPEANGGVQSPAIRARDGRLWFAMQAGAAVVDPADIDRSEGPFPVWIEELLVDGNALPVPSTASPGTVSLKANQRSFDVVYTGLSLSAPENLRFQYRLEGFQESWVDAGDRRTAFFTNVPPGTHTFRVRAAKGDGAWQEQQNFLTLEVAPFFYETAWFRITAAAGILLLVLGAFRARELRHRRQAQHLEHLVTQRTATIEAQAARLRELDEAKSRFFANVSHEFRTPLTLTIGPIEDLLAGTHGPIRADTAEQLELSLRNSRRLLRLVNQLLDVARIESGETELRASKGDLASFLGGVGLAFVPLAERRSIRFTRDVPDAAVEAVFDPELLEKVMMNLLSNAFKFTPAGGSVRLALFEEGPEVGAFRIQVRDSGPGIPPDELPHVFERFFRADEHRATKGTGIGLSLAKELVELHGGTLEVESEEGFGSTFTVVLPRGRAHLRPDQIVEGQTSVPAPGPSEVMAYDTGTAIAVRDEQVESDWIPEDGDDVTTVLVVDDSGDVRRYLRHHLEDTYRVLEAGDGREGLAIARAHTPDLVVSDVMMPVMDGWELCEAMKSDPALDFVPILLLTARATTESKVEGLELGADDYLTKPFEVAELRARVDNLIESRRRLTERLSAGRSIAARRIDVRSKGDAFVERLHEVVEERMADPEFGVDELAKGVFESRSNLYRRLHELGLPSAAELIRSLRLQRAEQLLEGGAGSVAEVAYAVGFRSVSHFSRSFKELYGHSPSRHARSSQPSS